MADLIPKSAIPSEGSIRANSPALRNPPWANHNGYHQAAAAAGVITEIRAGAGPVVALPWGATSDQRAQPYQR